MQEAADELGTFSCGSCPRHRRSAGVEDYCVRYWQFRGFHLVGDDDSLRRADAQYCPTSGGVTFLGPILPTCTACSSDNAFFCCIFFAPPPVSTNGDKPECQRSPTPVPSPFFARASVSRPVPRPSTLLCRAVAHLHVTGFQQVAARCTTQEWSFWRSGTPLAVCTSVVCAGVRGEDSPRVDGVEGTPSNQESNSHYSSRLGSHAQRACQTDLEASERTCCSAA